MSDVIVIGGGVIGLLSALRLAEAGMSVELFEKSDPSTESSWAGLGVLSPSATAGRPAALVQLMRASLALYAPLAAQLREQTSIDVAFVQAGMLYAALNSQEMDELAENRRAQDACGVPVQLLTVSEARALEPLLSPDVTGILYYTESGAVDNWRLGSALVMAATGAGVKLHARQEVTEVVSEGGRVAGVLVAGELHRARIVVIAAGAWSGRIGGVRLPVSPAKGQSLLLDCAPVQGFRVTRVLDSHLGYVVPRHGSRVLVGATVEDAGFDKHVSEEAIDHLVKGAVTLVPSLSGAVVRETWAGLRPRSADDQPIIGPVRGCDGLIAATGHFRNGILLAPATAQLVSEFATGRAPSFDAKTFAPERFGAVV